MKSAIANHLWKLTCEPARRRLAIALRNPAVAQSKVLKRILKTARGSEFACQHKLTGEMSISEFQHAVPISGYAEHEASIQRMMAGGLNVLCGQRVEAFERSSGSTSAAKFIPLTSGLKWEFQEAVRAWIGDLFSRHPNAMAGPAWWVISPLRQPREVTSGGIPVGLASDEEYLGFWEQKFSSWLMAVPSAIASIENLDESLNWTLRFLLQQPALRLISVWNASYLCLLWKRFEIDAAYFLEQLETGRGPDANPLLVTHLKAMPERARMLRNVAQLVPQDVWPNLAVISAWADAEAAGDAAQARSLFPHAVFQPKGLLATEGVVTIPWGSESDAGVPALNSHFLEFLEEPDGAVRLVHELELGKDYAVVLTTSGGLWRYKLGDIVRVEGWIENAPRLRFIGRGDDVCDLRGEKLHATFVSRALRSHAEGFQLLVPNRQGDTPHYILFARQINSDASEIDAALAENPYYAHARSVGQLGQVQVIKVMDEEPEALFLQRCVALGQRAGAVKSTCLHKADGWTEVFNREAANQ